MRRNFALMAVAVAASAGIGSAGGNYSVNTAHQQAFVVSEP